MANPEKTSNTGHTIRRKTKQNTTHYVLDTTIHKQEHIT